MSASLLSNLSSDFSSYRSSQHITRVNLWAMLIATGFNASRSVCRFLQISLLYFHSTYYIQLHYFHFTFFEYLTVLFLSCFVKSTTLIVPQKYYGFVLNNFVNFKILPLCKLIRYMNIQSHPNVVL